MSKYAPQLNDFKFGEWSPLMYGRTDLDHYKRGCETLENMLVMPYGGAFRRPGTYYVVPTKYQDKKARLVPFSPTQEDSYILEFGDKYIRMYKDNGQIVYTLGDVDDFDPTDNYAIGDYANHGDYIKVTCGNGRYMYFSKPQTEPADPGIESDKSVVITTAADDNLAVSSADNLQVDIALANTTASKNASDLIQTAIQALGSPFDDWFVTENPIDIVGNIVPEMTGNTSGDVLLLHMDGADAGTTFTDSATGKTVTAVGNAQTKTDQKKFGTASGYFDGSGDYLSIPTSTDFDFGSGDWTVDCWVRPDLSTGRTILGSGQGIIYIENSTSVSVYSNWSTVNKFTIPALSANTWYHIAVVRDGANLRLFIDGTLVGTKIAAASYNFSTTTTIGSYTRSAEFYRGYIDELRVTKGIARFTSDFTPAVSAYSVDNTGISASTEESTVTAAWKAADGDDDTAWYASRFTTTGWLQVKFDSPKTITDYAITAPADETRSPDDFKLYGSTTGAFGGEEVELDSQSGASFTSGERQAYNFVNVTAYTYYRVVVTANGGNSDWLAIAELELSEDGFSAGTGEAAAEMMGGGTFNGVFTEDDNVYICTTAVTAEEGNSSMFPAGEPDYWEADNSYEIVTPYLEADLFDLQFAQSNDVLYIAHSDYPPMKLSRYGDTDWTIEEVDFKFGAWADENLTAITMTPSAATGTGKTMTASSAYWEAGHVGSLFRYDTNDADCGYVKITSITSPTVANCDIIEELSGTAAKAEWAEGAWSIKNGYPRSVTFLEQRLFWGGTTAKPNTVWGSETESYESHKPGADDDNAVSYELASDQLNAITWMIQGKGLVIGTAGGAFTLSGGGSPLTPSNVQAVRDVGFGASTVVPVRIGTYVYYIDKNDRTVREYQYSFDNDSFIAKDMTILAEHITESGIVQMSYQQSPYGVLWAVRDDGEMACFTRQLEEQVQAWSRITTDGYFESVATIPNGEEDEVWVVVRREVGGEVVRYIEYFKPFKPDDELEDSFYLDSGLTYEGTPATSFSGMTHLAGKTIDVLADGDVVENVVVSAGGAFTLTTAASKVHAGLPFTSDLLTLNLEGGSQIGTSQAMNKVVWKATVRAYNTMDCYMGAATGNMDLVAFSTTDLTNGDKEIHFPKGWDRKGQIKITQSKPLPLVILAIYPRVTVNEG